MSQVIKFNMQYLAALGTLFNKEFLTALGTPSVVKKAD